MRFQKCFRLCPAIAWRATFPKNSLRRVDVPTCEECNTPIRKMDKCPNPEMRKEAMKKWRQYA